MKWCGGHETLKYVFVVVMSIVITQGGKLEAVAHTYFGNYSIYNGVIMNVTQNIHPVEHYQVKISCRSNIDVF